MRVFSVKAKSYSLWEGLHLPLKILKNGKWLLLIYYVSSTELWLQPFVTSDNPPISPVFSFPFSQRANQHDSILPSPFPLLMPVPCCQFPAWFLKWLFIIYRTDPKPLVWPQCPLPPDCKPHFQFITSNLFHSS